MAHSLLCIDVGNSRIKFGLFDRAECVAQAGLPRCLNSAVTGIDEPIPWDEVLTWAAGKNSTALAGVVAGGNPAGIQRVYRGWPKDLGPLTTITNDPHRFPLTIHVNEPDRVGIDRLLNAVAANARRPQQCPALIVDIGTATTIDVVSADGLFQGGAILPGFELCARSLHRYTALLPLISIDELAAAPHDPLGKSTRQAICSGLLWGQIGAVEGLVQRLSERLADDNRTAPTGQSDDAEPLPPILFLTGGGAALLAPHVSGAQLHPHLALQGLALVAQQGE